MGFRFYHWAFFEKRSSKHKNSEGPFQPHNRNIFETRGQGETSWQEKIIFIYLVTLCQYIQVLLRYKLQTQICLVYLLYNDTVQTLKKMSMKSQLFYQRWRCLLTLTGMFYCLAWSSYIFQQPCAAWGWTCADCFQRRYPGFWPHPQPLKLCLGSINASQGNFVAFPDTEPAWTWLEMSPLAVRMT